MTCEELEGIIEVVKTLGIKSLTEDQIKRLLICSMKSHNIGCNCGESLDWERI